MRFRKRGFPRPSTKSGQVEWAAGLFFLLFLGILLCALLQLDIYRSSSQYLEDALALSNLASAVVDVEEYGKSHKLVITDPRQAYERYKSAVKENLNLNDQWECQGDGVITGPVIIVNYTVYSVSGNDVEVSRFDEDGLLTQWREQLGSAVAPNGIKIEATGVYSEITYQLEGFLGTVAEARKGKLADIVTNDTTTN
ncbi:MAG: hypothetical protein J1E01_08870 [Acetatifactor sp.]|nr:hypothetical protein [Acetatifactor sp.]